MERDGRAKLATILLIGFDHPEAARLAEDLRSNANRHEFQSIGSDVADTPGTDSGIALVWCPRSSADAAAMIGEAVSNGLPTVALVQESLLPPIDFSNGDIEIAFAPFGFPEVLSRLDIVSSRANGPADRNLITHGDLVIDQDRYEVTLGGKKIDLTYKEYELLKYIAARPGRVFSREALLRAVWDYDYFGGTRTVDVHVRRLRSKINDVRYQFIETVWNVGYRFRSANDPPSG